ncbi:phage major capsid protein [Rossellomorea vietnamensis]|uniref:Phage major capsid protein n=1 Tax=Rossellomorea vietnamensis TaxID=218284 RepID=A0A5D4NLA4_9BACI|nr:phage major capsid protein [Rossellomorea vietnamensis]TYS14278.1 phage major capsid protein [Rossellomorea vietnamensis]
MNRKLLLSLQKRNKSRLTELRTKLEKGEVREEEVEAVQTEVDELTAEAQEIADELANLEDDGEGDAGAAGSDGDSKDDDNGDESGEGNADGESGKDTGDEGESRSKGISTEHRDNIMSQIGKGLSTRGHKSTKKKEKEIRSAFANFVVGNITEAEARSLGVDINNGSVTVPITVSREVITYAQEENLLRKYGSYVATDADVKYPVLVKKADANVNKTERTDNEIPETDIEFDSIDLDPAEFDALATITKKLLKRTGVNIENIVIEELKKAYVRKETNYMFNGDDAGNENPGALAKKSRPFYETVPVVVGEEKWSQVLQDQLAIMIGEPVTEVIKKGRWIVNRAAYNILNRMTDVNGRKLLTKTNGIYEYEGFPLDFTDAANKSTTDTVTPVFYFGDFKAFHIQEVKGGMELQKLVEKYAGTNKVGFKIYYLIDGQLIYSPFEPAVYRYEVGATDSAGA